MTSSSSSLLSPRQRRQIRVVMGGRCEGCGETGDPVRLQIHETAVSSPHPDQRILVLCPRCSAGFQAIDPTILARWLDHRSFHQRRLLRKILPYHSLPYTPPEGMDLEELYRAACTGWCLNGSG
jgi:hypothetical protein